MTRCLVTGATGFLGGHLVEALCARGFEVRCLARPTSSRRWLDHLEVEWRVARLDEPTSLREAARGCEWVFHVAGLTRGRNQIEYDLTNVSGTQAMLGACLDEGDALQRFVLVSSLAAAGPSSSGAPLTEDESCRPVSPYGRSKLAGEQLALQVADRLPIVIVRPSVIYGPRDTDNLLLFRLARWGVRPGVGRIKTLSLIYVRDAAEGLVCAAQSAAPSGRAYFLSDGVSYQLDQVLLKAQAVLGARGIGMPIPWPLLYYAAAVSEIASRLTGRVGPLTRNKVVEAAFAHWTCSPQRAIRELGFVPSAALEDGLRETLGWYKQRGWL